MNHYTAAALKGSGFPISAILKHDKRDFIIELTSNHFGIDKELLFKRDRHDSTVKARMLVMYYMYRILGYTLSETGRFFNRDHTTVIHAVRKVDTALNPKYEHQEREIYEKILSIV